MPRSVRISWFDPSMLSVDRTAMLRPGIEVVKSIVSSTEGAHCLVSPRLGDLLHVPSAFTMIFSMVDFSSAQKISLSRSSFVIENGNFEAMLRDKINLLGIVSRMSDIGITVPIFRMDRKSLPGPTHLFTCFSLAPVILSIVVDNGKSGKQSNVLRRIRTGGGWR